MSCPVFQRCHGAQIGDECFPEQIGVSYNGTYIPPSQELIFLPQQTHNSTADFEVGIPNPPHFHRDNSHWEKSAVVNMPYIRSWFHAKSISLRQKSAKAMRHDFDPYPALPKDVRLSPSQWHGEAMMDVPVAMSWSKTDGGDAAAWQPVAREKLGQLLGLETRPRPEVIFDEAEPLPGGLLSRRIYLRIRACTDIPLRLVWASDMDNSTPRPAMICLQGHNAGMHLSWGETRMPADPLKIARSGLDYGRQAVARGYIAVCVEQAGFGERREQAMAKRSSHPCFDAAHQALMLGRTLLGERVADVMSVIDWLAGGEANLDIDMARIHAMGNSAGGETSLYVAAMDERLGGAIASGCVGRFRRTIATRATCPDTILPGILNWLENDDVLALCAPRPLLVVSGDRDHIYPFAEAAATAGLARDVYQELAASDMLRAIEGRGGHRFYPDQAWPEFLAMCAQSRA